MSIITDRYVFPALVAAFVAFAIYAGVRNARWQRPGEVKRGNVAREWFYWFFGFASVVVTQIINATEALKDYTVLVNLVCLGALTHLLFFNGWFRNLLLGYKAKYDQRTE